MLYKRDGPDFSPGMSQGLDLYKKIGSKSSYQSMESCMDHLQKSLSKLRVQGIRGSSEILKNHKELNV